MFKSAITKDGEKGIIDQLIKLINNVTIGAKINKIEDEKKGELIPLLVIL